MTRRIVVLLACIATVALYLVFRDRGGGPEDNGAPKEFQVEQKKAAPLVLTEGDRVRQQLLATLTYAPGQGFPGVLPWLALEEIGAKGGYPLENLLHSQPVVFFEMCLDRYKQEVQGYSLLFRKRERINGKLYPAEKDKYETVAVDFREKPFSVYFNWVQEAKIAQKVLYVEGQNNGMMLARPKGLLSFALVSREVNGAEAKSSGRYTIDQFGLFFATQRVVDNMRRAEARGKLFVEYQGLVTLAEVGNRPCYKFVRKPYDPPEEEGVNELVLFVDQETWLQVGSILRDREGNLIAEYFFSDIRLNPEFSEKQFTRGAI
jgi:hypothetical protein